MTIRDVVGSGNKLMSVALGNATDNVILIDGTGGIDISSVITGTNRNLTLDGTGFDGANDAILNLLAANTYSGKTTIRRGVLALLGSASIANSSSIEIGGGTYFDVQSLLVSLTLSAGQGLTASGNTSTGYVATSGTKGLTTSATSPVEFSAFNPSVPPLTLLGTAFLALQTTNPVTVTVANGGTPLGVGQYKLIAKGSTGVVTGTPSSVTVNGDGLQSGTAASLTLTGGELFLSVTAAATPPTVATDAATGVTGATATLHGITNPNGTTSIGWFRYYTTDPGACSDSLGTRAPVSGNISLGSGTSSVPFLTFVSGLSPATTYYYCAFSSNAGGTAIGSVFSFTTAALPSVVSAPATSVGSTGVTLRGYVTPNGAPTTAWFRYSTVDPGGCNDTFGTRIPAFGGVIIGAGTSQVPYSYRLTGLSPTTTYYFCPIAQSDAGKSWGVPFSFTTSSPEIQSRSMWVFGDAITPNPVATTAGRNALVGRSVLQNVDKLFVSVYQSSANSNGRLMYEDADVAALIDLAHSRGQEVWAAYGAPDWPTFGCSISDFPVQRMTEVADYNALHPTEAFTGVMLDVESAPASPAEFQALLAHYECIRSSLPSSIKLGVAINAFWDQTVTYPVIGGFVKPAYQHIIDMDLDKVVVMGYRDLAGTDTCPSSDGIICLDKDEVDYATSLEKRTLILAGLETKDLGISSDLLANETFYEEGNVAMTTESDTVAGYFAPDNGFGGFAIHNYSDAYLSGEAGWPFAPTAAPVIVAGSVADPYGRGLTGAVVKLTDENGEIRTARTNTFGRFIFSGVTVGRTYLITVTAKSYRFEPKLLNVTDELKDIVLSPIP